MGTAREATQSGRKLYKLKDKIEARKFFKKFLVISKEESQRFFALFSPCQSYDWCSLLHLPSKPSMHVSLQSRLAKDWEISKIETLKCCFLQFRHWINVFSCAIFW